MQIDKFGPPEGIFPNIDFDIYFRLSKDEAETISNPATQAAITAALIAAGGPYGAAAAALIVGYFGQIGGKIGPNGCSVKLTIRNGLGGVMQMKEFIAEPI